MIDLIGVIWLMARTLSYTVLLIILLYAGRDLRGYMNLNFYRKQGIKCFYWPFFGVATQWIPDPKQNDALGKIRKFYEKVQDEPIVMFNNHRTTCCAGLFLDPSLIKELFVKEIEYCIKEELISNANGGFFFEKSEKAFEQRVIYTKFFHFQNMKSLTESTCKIVDKTFREISEKHLKEPGSKYQMKVKDTLGGIFYQIVNQVLYGEDKPNMMDTGEDLTRSIEKNIEEMFLLTNDPLNVLTANILHDLGILPKTRSYQKNLKRIEDKCIEVFEARKKQGPKSTPNILDLLIEKDQTDQKEGKKPKEKREIAGNFILFQGAGADTSKQVTTGAIMLLAKYHDQQEKLMSTTREIFQKSEQENRRYLDYEDIDHPVFDQFVKEFIRLGAPVPILIPRQFIKPCQIGKYKFNTGDRIEIPVQLMHTISGKWPNPFEFEPSRFSPENQPSIEKTSYLPFGLGKRNCVGKTFGEMNVKIIVLYFMKYFKVEKDDSYVENKFQAMTYGYLNPTVIVSKSE